MGNFYILLAGVGLLDPNHIPSTITTTSTISKLRAIPKNKDTKQIGNGSGTNGHGDSPINTPSFELTSYNHMEMIYRDIINPDINSVVNPGASIVAFKWLNIEKPQIVIKRQLDLLKIPRRLHRIHLRRFMDTELINISHMEYVIQSQQNKRVWH